MSRPYVLLFFLTWIPAASGRQPPAAAGDPCSRTADLARKASLMEAKADFFVGLANCQNDTSRDPEECEEELLEDLEEALELIEEQYLARLGLCLQLGGGPYDPPIDPNDFSPVITNPLFPLVPGVTLVYESETSDGLERIEVTLLETTFCIDGVECAGVQDTVTLDGELIEDTVDWYAQDTAGNVWYFGEISQNYEDGLLDSLDGSWRTGKDGAKPGIIMWASPQIGDVYRQEFLINEAEDAAEVLSLDEEVTVPYGTFQNCLQTLDFTPLEPDAVEHKFYAPGIGVVLEVDLESGETVELVDVISS